MTTRSALFVDFDNVYAGLGGIDPSAAHAFATEPARWLRWLAGGLDQPAGRPRRFLVQVCYLSESSSRYRRAFVESGFRVVDCPTLTCAGKNSADIHLVIDALDALAAETRYDEFVIASADADFAPLLHRLREADRRTTVLRGGPAAAAYTSLCDAHIRSEDFARALVGRRGALSVPAQRSEPATAVEDAVTAVLALVSASPVPVSGGKAANVARDACPGIAPGWVGTGSFGGFLAEHLPSLRWTSQPGHGYLYDPKQHRTTAIVR